MSQQKPISKNQLRMLYSLWNLYATGDDDREHRLRWASKNLGRQVTSFSTLTSAEAKSLADVLRTGLETVPWK